MRRIAGSIALSVVFTVGCPADDSEDSESQASEESDTPMTESGPSTESDDSSAELGCAKDGVNIDSGDGAMDPLMGMWGSACTTDDECVTRLGAGAICEDEAVVYELPGGYCTKPCSLPDNNTRVVLDDLGCDPAGGVACIGQKPLFERCTKICTDDMQCERDGYECRTMPIIGMEADPKSCLMPDCCETNC